MPAKTREEHLAMMAEPDRWPRWPYLPLTRGAELGLMTAIISHRTTVFLQNLFMLPERAADFLDGPKIVYASFEEIVQDGWIVEV